MSTITRIELSPTPEYEVEVRADNILQEDLSIHGLPSNCVFDACVAAHSSVELQSLTGGTSDSARALSARMQQLIKLEGGASVIAERCGFSEGAVRNWRDGRSDMSRERCITMAQALGISLLWLVAGEGPMKIEAEHFSQPTAIHAVEPPPGQRVSVTSSSPTLDTGRLAAALRLLQSYIGLIGGSLDPNSRADRLVELYDILSHTDGTTYISRLINFHNALGGQLRRRRSLIT